MTYVKMVTVPLLTPPPAHRLRSQRAAPPSGWPPAPRRAAATDPRSASGVARPTSNGYSDPLFSALSRSQPLSFVIRTLFGSKGLALATRQVRWLTFAVRKELTHGILDAISIRREPILVELGGSCISRSSPFPYLFPFGSCRAARKTLTIMGRVANDLNNSGGPCAIKSTNFNEVTVTAVELRPRKVALGIVTWCTKRPLCSRSRWPCSGSNKYFLPLPPNA